MAQRLRNARTVFDVVLGSVTAVAARGVPGFLRQTTTFAAWQPLADIGVHSPSAGSIGRLRPRTASGHGAADHPLPGQLGVQTSNSSQSSSTRFWKSFGSSAAAGRINVFSFFQNSIEGPVLRYAAVDPTIEPLMRAALPSMV